MYENKGVQLLEIKNEQRYETSRITDEFLKKAKGKFGSHILTEFLHRNDAPSVSQE